jgi:H+/Cl- antiporter ClcA
MLGAKGATTAAATLLALALFKSVAYAISLGSGFRGGPVFPSLFIGATVGMLAGVTLPGMSPLAGFSAGMAAGTASMLRLPLSALVIVGLLTGAAGLQVLPIAIIAVVVAVVVRAFTDKNDPAAKAAPHPA